MRYGDVGKSVTIFSENSQKEQKGGNEGNVADLCQRKKFLQTMRG